MSCQSTELSTAMSAMLMDSIYKKETIKILERNLIGRGKKTKEQQQKKSVSRNEDIISSYCQ